MENLIAVQCNKLFIHAHINESKIIMLNQRRYQKKVYMILISVEF